MLVTFIRIHSTKYHSTAFIAALHSLRHSFLKHLLCSNVMRSVYDDACSLMKYVTIDVSKRFIQRAAPDIASGLTAALIDSLRQ